MIKWQTQFACCILCELSLLLHDSVIYTVIPYWLKVNEKVNHGHFNIQCIVFCLWEIAYAYGKLCCKLTQIFNSGQHKTRPTSKMTRYGAQLIFLVNVGLHNHCQKDFQGFILDCAKFFCKRDYMLSHAKIYRESMNSTSSD